MTSAYGWNKRIHCEVALPYYVCVWKTDGVYDKCYTEREKSMSVIEALFSSFNCSSNARTVLTTFTVIFSEQDSGASYWNFFLCWTGQWGQQGRGGRPATRWHHFRNQWWKHIRHAERGGSEQDQKLKDPSGAAGWEVNWPAFVQLAKHSSNACEVCCIQYVELINML